MLAGYVKKGFLVAPIKPNENKKSYIKRLHWLVVKMDNHRLCLFAVNVRVFVRGEKILYDRDSNH